MTGGVTCAADDGTGGLLRGPAHLDRAAREEGKRPPEGGSGGRRSVRSSSRITQHASGRFTPGPSRGEVPRTSATCRANRFRASGQSRSVAVVNIINFTDTERLCMGVRRQEVG